MFDAAIVREVRIKANPCTGVTSVLGPIQKSVTHRRALPWSDVPRFVSDLRAGPAKPMTRLAFEFLILTAARSEEVRRADWAEIDLEERLWTVPADRMKMKRSHRVPLSDRASARRGTKQRVPSSGSLTATAEGTLDVATEHLNRLLTKANQSVPG